VKEAVRVGYRKSIQKVLQSIKEKIGFELLFLSHLVGNQEAVFLEWLDILQTSNPFPSVMFNRDFEQVDVTTILQHSEGRYSERHRRDEEGGLLD
jgi:hypothetical protein